ncbi:MAG: hypothetical protein U1E05_27860 [Patescibacteria group bacterium]|nr:hypothetical protein [Patescibacteria group bacterium]
MDCENSGRMDSGELLLACWELLGELQRAIRSHTREIAAQLDRIEAAIERIAPAPPPANDAGIWNRQRAAIAFLESWVRRTGDVPTIRQLAAEIGVSDRTMRSGGWPQFRAVYDALKEQSRRDRGVRGTKHAGKVEAWTE